jgi:hypothetical protein
MSNSSKRIRPVYAGKCPKSGLKGASISTRGVLKTDERFRHPMLGRRASQEQTASQEKSMRRVLRSLLIAAIALGGRALPFAQVPTSGNVFFGYSYAQGEVAGRQPGMMVGMVR